MGYGSAISEFFLPGIFVISHVRVFAELAVDLLAEGPLSGSVNNEHLVEPVSNSLFQVVFKRRQLPV